MDKVDEILEINRWYELKLKVDDRRVQAYIDGRKLQDFIMFGTERPMNFQRDKNHILVVFFLDYLIFRA